jgi:hypothetical protein
MRELGPQLHSAVGGYPVRLVFDQKPQSCELLSVGPSVLDRVFIHDAKQHEDRSAYPGGIH